MTTISPWQRQWHGCGALVGRQVCTQGFIVIGHKGWAVRHAPDNNAKPIAGIISSLFMVRVTGCSVL